MSTLKPNKKYRDIPYSKKNVFSVNIWLLTFLQITFYLDQLQLPNMKNDKSRPWRVALCPQPRVLRSKQIFLWCGTMPDHAGEAKMLNDGWAHKTVLSLIKMRFQSLWFQGFALIFIFLRPARVAVMFCLGPSLIWVTNTSRRKKQHQLTNRSCLLTAHYVRGSRLDAQRTQKHTQCSYILSASQG